jgi:hypothetical protein
MYDVPKAPEPTDAESAPIRPAQPEIQPAPPLAVPMEPMPELPPMQPEPAAKPREPMDDLFGDKPAAKPAPMDDLFGDKPAAPPAAKPAPMDDLFGDKPVVPPMDVAPPAAKPAAPLDDLFNESPKPAAPQPGDMKPAAPAVDDIFAPPAKPAAPAKDDLFDAPAAPPAKPAPAVVDPFGSVERSQPQLLVMRRWQDNTGNFAVQAKLFEILDGKVRLLKDNGRTCTVPLHRLSRADAEYVQFIVAKVGTGTLGHLASH